MTRFVFALAAFVLLVGGGAAASLAGDYGPPPPDKVFVCKYVGQPGVDETLQTGQNPISVSINAIPDFPGVGGFFADAQGRSLVVAFDTGQAEPSCPDGQGCETDCTPPTDFCPTLPGVQAEDEDCPPPPPTDVCPNLDGVQTQVPPGYGLIGDLCLPVDINPQCTINCDNPPPPPPPAFQDVGEVSLYCDLNVYRLRGTVDGHAADTVDPATLPGTTHGTTNVTLHLGDTAFRTSVFTYGDCGPATTGTTTVVTAVVTPVTPAAPAAPTAPKPVAKPKPKPAPKAKPKPKAPIVHTCKPVNGHPRVWVKTAGPTHGCQYVKPAQPEKLTG